MGVGIGLVTVVLPLGRLVTQAELQPATAGRKSGIVERALQLGAPAPPVQVFIGAARASGGRDADAIAAWREALDGGMPPSQLIPLIANALLRRADAAGAAALLLDRAKRLEPDKASIREALGRALLMSGHAGRARREFTKVVQLHPADDYAHFALALACERTGQRTRARGHAKLAVALRPGVEA